MDLEEDLDREVIDMAWTKYSGGSGPVAPVFPRTSLRIAGIPMDGRGNQYSPNKPPMAYRANGVVRPGGGLGPAGSNSGLKFR